MLHEQRNSGQSQLAPALPSLTLGWNLLEYMVVFLAGFLLMQYFLHHPNLLHGELGVPEHDSWYHMKMAIMMPEAGFVGRLPWLQYGYLDPSDKTGNHFVSHHVGFQVLLIPFLYVSKWLTGHWEPGARWAMGTFFGAVLVLIDMLLITARVRWRWMWLAAVLLLPNHFFLRAGFIRAISASLALMLLVVLALFRNRPVFTGVATMLYALLYLGSLPFAPVIIGTFALCCFIGPHGERRFPTKLVAYAMIGLCIGFLLYPYDKRSMLEFLRLQILGTGLGADIEVGTEWRPYNNTWWFMQMAGPLLAIWAVAVALRLRFGPQLDAPTATLVLLNFGFLLLALKARRFVEYWPAFGLLSAAYMASPVLDRAANAWAAWKERRSALATPLTLAGGTALLATSALIGFKLVTAPDDTPWDWIQNEWVMDPWIWAVFAIAGLFFLVRAIDVDEQRVSRHLLRVGSFAVLFVFTFSFVAAANAGQLIKTRNELRCFYPLKDVRGALDYIREHSNQGDIVFTDDWDDFGLYFYHNSHNYYIVGLDPKFTQERRPDLWERFVKITRGQTPATSTVTMTLPDGRKVKEQVQSRLEDIRDYFKAKFVICDRDHGGLSRKLADSNGFAQLVYPCEDYSKCGKSRYLVFRVSETPATRAAAQRTASGRRIVQLADLPPVNIDSLSGDCFAQDELVGGGVLRVGLETHLRGVSTRSGCGAKYEIPEGFTRFQAAFGLPPRTSAYPPIKVQVLLDGKIVFAESAGEAGILPVAIDLPLGGASTLELLAETARAPQTDEAPLSFAWGSARLVRTE